MRTLTIAYVQKGYREKRNFLFATRHRYKQVFDYNKLMAFVIFKFSKTINYTYLNSFNDFGLNNYDILHLFHGISRNDKPWIMTFSTKVPRSSRNTAKDVKRLAADSCKQLIALSSNAERLLSHYMDESFPAYAAKIKSKITVLHPPQEVLVSDYNHKQVVGARIKFCIIGADFFRKGGKEIVDAFLRLKSEGVTNWELVIVSSLQFGDYATKTTDADKTDVFNKIQATPEITYFERLPNDKVLALLKECHVGLLPTWAETYGYSVLESQACGCPVITTDVRALPEVNSDSRGWVLEVPKDAFGNGILETSEDRAAFSGILGQQLYVTIAEILKNPGQIEQKGIASIEYIRNNHSVERHAQRLDEIYLKALKEI